MQAIFERKEIHHTESSQTSLLKYSASSKINDTR